MRDAGVDEILLLGASTIAGELETVGAWQRAIHCPVGLLRLDEPPRRFIAEFETAADLIRATRVAGLALAI